MSSSSQPPSIDRLAAAVRSIETRGSATADLPPLSPDASGAAKKGLALLSRRRQSRRELRERLLAAEFPPEAVDEALDRFGAWGLLDDAAFAAEWVDSRRRRRGKSAGALRRELQAKGIAEPQITAALDPIDPGDERDLASELIRTRLARRGAGAAQFAGDRDARQKERRRLVSFLERRGFASGLALSVVDEQMSALED